MKTKRESYIPALRFHWLTRWYDPLIQWGMREAAFKGHLVRQARVQSGQQVLDLACGTGTLTLMIKQTQPAAQVTGLDADPEILAIAREKAARQGVHLAFDKGMSYDLPYPDRSFDHVFSSLFFHHLTREKKRKTLNEVYRVLRPGGGLHIIDFAQPHNRWMRVAFLSVQLLDGFEPTRDHVSGLLPHFIEDAGFQAVRETARFSTILGTLRAYSAQKPF